MGKTDTQQTTDQPAPIQATQITTGVPVGATTLVTFPTVNDGLNHRADEIVRALMFFGVTSVVVDNGDGTSTLSFWKDQPKAVA